MFDPERIRKIFEDAGGGRAAGTAAVTPNSRSPASTPHRTPLVIDLLRHEFLDEP